MQAASPVSGGGTDGRCLLSGRGRAGAHFPPAPRRGILLRKLMRRTQKARQLIRPSAALWVQSRAVESPRVAQRRWALVCGSLGLALADAGGLRFAGARSATRAAREEPLGLAALPAVFVPGVLPWTRDPGAIWGIQWARLHVAQRAERGVRCLAHDCREEDTAHRVHLLSKHPRAAVSRTTVVLGVLF